MPATPHTHRSNLFRSRGFLGSKALHAILYASLYFTLSGYHEDRTALAGPYVTLQRKFLAILPYSFTLALPLLHFACR